MQIRLAQSCYSYGILRAYRWDHAFQLLVQLEKCVCQLEIYNSLIKDLI